MSAALLVSPSGGQSDGEGDRENALSDSWDDDSSEDSTGGSKHRRYCFGRLSRGWCAVLLLGIAGSAALITTLLTHAIGRLVAARVIRSLDIVFDKIDVGDINGTSTLHPHIVGRVVKPSPFDVETYPAQALLSASVGGSKSGDYEFAEVGSLTIPSIHIKGGADFVLDIVLPLQLDHMDAFALAGKHFIVSEHSSFLIEASLDVECWIFGLPLRLRGIPLKKPIVLQGMRGFSQESSPITMQAMTHAYGRANALDITVNVSLYNPSYMAATITPKLQFEVTQRLQPFGVATLDGLRFEPGTNFLVLQFALQQTGSNIDAIKAFILDFISAEQVQPVTVHGSNQSTTDPFLSRIFDDLTLPFNFRPPPMRFIEGVGVDIGLGVKAKAQIFNPLPQRIIMGALDLKINENDIDGQQIFRLDTAMSDTGLEGATLQPSQESTLDIWLSPLGAKAALSSFSLIRRLIEAAEAGRIVVGVKGPVTITIWPSFWVTVDYFANNVTATLKCPLLCGR